MSNKKNPIVSIIMGSQSDWESVKPASKILEEFSIPHECKIISAHRTPDRHKTFATKAKKRGIKVILAAAGGAAHLAGVTAAHTPLPVLGIPMESKLSGLDSLLSTVQMPSGVPVATFAIGDSGSKNAALFAIRIIALEDSLVASKLNQYIKKMEKAVPEKPKK
ncbi:MAG TPA: 5-(carboxyamino)imidazole ribonucleotide mutase [Pelagibacteraceae bacterium]|mgnify:FL=1|jgi:5-(carboxyamino)imidazole ribonucleotide mutase|nr:5-(carboxyamino)imidazole ribonucleotide mutase [Pelagibacteraceae bacterium]